MEVKIVNESDTQLTVEDIGAKVRVGGKWIRWIAPFTRRTVVPKHIADVAHFESSPHEGQPQDKALTGLLATIKGIPLVRGVGYRGWICFALNANQRELNDHPSLDVWLVDAFDKKHKLIYEKNDGTWDKSFDVVEHF